MTIIAQGRGGGVFSAAELMAKEFGEERWAVHGILPEGVTIFAGKSKIGKSWMAY